MKRKQESDDTRPSNKQRTLANAELEATLDGVKIKF